MRRLQWIGCVVCALWWTGAALSAADDLPIAPSADERAKVSVVDTTSWCTNELARVTSFLAAELAHEAFWVSEATSLGPRDCRAIRDGRPDVLVVLVLTTNTPSRLAFSESTRVALLDPFRLLNDSGLDKTSDSSAEKFQHLLNKEALRASLLALGLKPCPYPGCCLFQDTTPIELLQKAINLCPPCHVNYIERFLSSEHSLETD